MISNPDSFVLHQQVHQTLAGSGCAGFISWCIPCSPYAWRSYSGFVSGCRKHSVEGEVKSGACQNDPQIAMTNRSFERLQAGQIEIDQPWPIASVTSHQGVGIVGCWSSAMRHQDVGARALIRQAVLMSGLQGKVVKLFVSFPTLRYGCVKSQSHWKLLTES